MNWVVDGWSMGRDGEGGRWELEEDFKRLKMS
jgi:hypothetical protein